MRKFLSCWAGLRWTSPVLREEENKDSFMATTLSWPADPLALLSPNIVPRDKPSTLL